MTCVTSPLHPHSGDLDRAISAIRLLEGSGLGQLDWVGPVWIGVMGDMDWKSLDFLATRIRQDTRLRRRIRKCRNSGERQRLQIHAIRIGLAEFESSTGQQSGVTADFLATCDTESSSEAELEPPRAA